MFRRFVFWFGVLMLSLAGSAYAVTAQQMKMFQQLSPADQQLILNNLGGSGSATTGSASTSTQLQPSQQAPSSTPTPINPSSSSSAAIPGQTATIGQTMLGQSVPGQTVDASMIPVQPNDTLILTIQPVTRSPATTGVTQQPTTGPLESQIGSHVYQVDPDGTINIMGMLKIPVAGLTSNQVADRLSAETLFANYVVTVKLLPLQATGPKALKPFGYDLFAGVPSTFAPATDIPVPADYVIGPDDTVQIQLYGKDNQQYSLVVTRDGVLNFPSLGPIDVAGLRYEEMKKLLKKRIAKQLIGDQASITMGPLRSIRIFVLGDAMRPGSYTVSALSTMTNALFVSGGITPVGSLRDVQLKRDGKVVRHLDLYDLLLRGDTSKDMRLLPGDVIFVPPIGRTVGIYGEVKRPAIYELRNEKTIAQVLAMAGGLLPTAAPNAIQIQRILPNGDRTVLDIDASSAKGADMLVADGDTVDVRSVLDTNHDYVRLSGYVERPGLYQWHKGMRLTDLLPTLDLLPARADLNYVLIKRELPPDLQIDVLSTRLDRAIAHPDSVDNVLLQPRDEVMVFSLTDDRAQLIEPIIEQLKAQARIDDPERVVHVSGDVAFPGAYPLEGGMRVADLIRAGGGLSQQAYTLDAELVRYKIVDNNLRETERVPVDLAAVLRGDSVKNLELKPFDTLHIKRMPEWYKSRMAVQVKGEVTFPGTYVIQKGEKLSELIKRAGGLTKWAFPKGAVLLRTDLQAKEQAQLNILHDRLKADMASLALQQSQVVEVKGGGGAQLGQSAAMAQSLLNQLESTKATGRLVINLPAIVDGDAQSDVTLQDGDKLYIPDIPQEVTVIGEVNFPTSLMYDSHYNLDDYVKHAGGFTYKADKGRTYVVRANGAVIASSSSIFGDSFPANIEVGDTIVVPVDVERMSPMLYWSSISQIIYQLGVAAAAWHTVGVF